MIDLLRKICDVNLALAALLICSLFFIPQAHAEKTLKKNPNFQSGYALFQQSRFAEAEPLLAAAVKVEPANLNAHFFYGCVLSHVNKYAQAISELNKSFSPDETPAITARTNKQIASCFGNSGDYAQAIKCYEALMRTPFSQNDPDVMNNLAKAYTMVGRTDKAFALQKEATRRGVEDMSAVADECVRLYRAGKVEEAIWLGENARSHGEHSIKLLRVLTQFHAERDEYAAELSLLNELCKRADLCAEFWGGKGECERLLKRYEDAINDLTVALKLNINAMMLRPGLSVDDARLVWQMHRTECYARLKGLPEALKRVNTLMAARSAGSDAALFLERGELYLWMKNYDKAISDLSNAIKLSRNVKQSRMFSLRRDAYAMTDNFAAAVADAKKFIELEPKVVPGYFYLGVLEIRQKHYKQAAECLNKTIYNHNKNETGWQTLYFEYRADAHFQMGEYTSAIADYTSAIQASGDAPWLLAGRALAYSKADMPDRALKDLESLKNCKSEQKIEYKIEDSDFPNPFQEYVCKSTTSRRKQLIAYADKLKPPAP